MSGVVARGELEAWRWLCAQTQSHPSFTALYSTALTGPAATTSSDAASAAVAPTPKAESANADADAATGAAARVVALDCEMVYAERDAMALARVTCVDLAGNVLVDMVVCPGKLASTCCHRDCPVDPRCRDHPVPTRSRRHARSTSLIPAPFRPLLSPVQTQASAV